MRVSYLVTLYDKAAFLPHLLAGLAAQEGDFAREFIFVDDGSRDGTLDQLRRLTFGWGEVRIISQENAGPAAAFNRGLGEVTGDWVKPVDGDDQLYPWATRALLAAAAAFGTDYAYAPMELQARYDVASAPLVPDPPDISPLRDADFLRRALRRAVTNPSLWIARADLLRGFGGADEGVFIQDYSLELRLAASGVAARVAAPVMAAPEQAPGRLSADEAQTLHDVNAALLRHLAVPGLAPAACRFGLCRAAGRAEKWARRHGGSRLPLLLALMKAKLGLLGANAATTRLLTAPFTLGRAIRPGTIRVGAGRGS